MEFSRQEYWSGWPFPSAGDLPNPGLSHCRWILYHLSQTPHKPWCLLATSPAPNHCNKTPHQIPPAWDTDLRAWACHVNKAFLLYPKLLRIDSALVHRGWVLASLVIQFQTSEFPPMVIHNYSKKKKKKELLFTESFRDSWRTHYRHHLLDSHTALRSRIYHERMEPAVRGWWGRWSNLLGVPRQQWASGHPASEGGAGPASQGMAHPEEPVPCSHRGSGQGTAATLGGDVRFTHSTAQAPPGRMQPRAGMFGLLGRRPRRLTLLS